MATPPTLSVEEIESLIECAIQNGVMLDRLNEMLIDALKMDLKKARYEVDSLKEQLNEAKHKW